MATKNRHKSVFKLALVFFCSLLATQSAWAQQRGRSTCARTLQLAQSLYERGELQKIPTLLEECLTHRGGKTGFTKEERVEALKIRTLSYLYREEPQKADRSMLELLRTDHFFKINEAIDPKELILLYKTFRSAPLFSIGGRVGINYTFPQVHQIYYAATTGKPAKSGKYSVAGGFQIGGNLNIPLSFLGEKNGVVRFYFAPNFWYINSAFLYNNGSQTQNEETNAPSSITEALFTQQRLAVDLMINYRITGITIRPYVGFGGSVSYLAEANAQIETQSISTNNIINGPQIDFTKNFNPISFNAIGAVGVEYQLETVTLFADIRYTYGLTSIPSSKSRINNEAAMEYGLVVNDFTQNSITFNIGFLIPYFSPKKKLQ